MSDLPILSPEIRVGLPPEVQAYLAFLEGQILVGSGRIHLLEKDLVPSRCRRVANAVDNPVTPGTPGFN